MQEEIRDLANDVDVIISSIPLTKDECVINTPFSKRMVYIEEVFEEIRGKTFIAGGVRTKHI